MPTDVDRSFEYENLPQYLQEVSKPIAIGAKLMDESLPDGSEKSEGMRKLLEAKDCFVQAKLPPQPETIDETVWEKKNS